MSVYRRQSGRAIPPRLGQGDKEKFVSLWEARLEESEAQKETWAKKFQVSELEQIYYGHQRPPDWPFERWFTVNLVFSSLKILRRSVVPRRLQVKVSLSKSLIPDMGVVAQYLNQVQLRQAVLQQMVKQLKMVEVLRKAYVEAQWAYGVVKIGYSADIETKRVSTDWERIKRDKTGNPIVKEDGSGFELVSNEEVLQEEFFVDPVDYSCFLVDRDCTGEIDRDARWVAHKIYRSLEDVKRDQLYHNKEGLAE